MSRSCALPNAKLSDRTKQRIYPMKKCSRSQNDAHERFDKSHVVKETNWKSNGFPFDVWNELELQLFFSAPSFHTQRTCTKLATPAAKQFHADQKNRIVQHGEEALRKSCMTGRIEQLYK